MILAWFRRNRKDPMKMDIAIKDSENHDAKIEIMSRRQQITLWFSWLAVKLANRIRQTADQAKCDIARHHGGSPYVNRAKIESQIRFHIASLTTHRLCGEIEGIWQGVTWQQHCGYMRTNRFERYLRIQNLVYIVQMMNHSKIPFASNFMKPEHAPHQNVVGSTNYFALGR